MWRLAEGWAREYLEVPITQGKITLSSKHLRTGVGQFDVDTCGYWAGLLPAGLGDPAACPAPPLPAAKPQTLLPATLAVDRRRKKREKEDL